MDKTERCDFCGALFNRYKRTIVNMMNEDNSRFTRSFIVCEECACGILEKAVNNDPMNKRCNKG